MKGNKRAKGGRIGGREHMWVSGNPDVKKEAEEEKEEGGSRKHGGRTKRATGGKVVKLMTGGGVRPRLDRPGRKRGGRVGADRSPLSSAHKGTAGGGGPTPSSHDTYGGLKPD